MKSDARFASTQGSLEATIAARWQAFVASPAFAALIFCVAVLLSAFLAYKALSNQITETMVLSEARVSLARYLDGTVTRPFAYRLLMPILVNFAQNVLHVPALIGMLPLGVPQKLAQLCTYASATPAASCDNVLAYAAVAYACFFGFLMTIYILTSRLFGRPVVSLLSIAFCFVTVNAIMLLKLSHVYDFEVMFLVSLLLLTLHCRKPILYTLLLAVAFAGKETTILYAGVALWVNFGRMPMLRNIGYFLVQILLFLIIHGSIRMHFAGNEGAGHEYYLPEQIYFFTEHINMTTLLLMVFSVILVFYRFPEKQEFLRRASIVLLPWTVLFLIGGVQRELRVMFEILPVVMLLSIDSLLRLVAPRAAVAGQG